ncbi:MAG: metallophosphoesterase [Myxococcales bacterium]|nr:metallophosphoesterase [Myxococcota bacterium]MDW8282127.1 metallophosphoesterase [Myxococcales bacterium]
MRPAHTALLALLALSPACVPPPPGPGLDPPDLAAPVPPGEDPRPDLRAPTPGSDLAPAEPVVRFVALGDTGKGNQGQRDVAAAIRRKCELSGCDFALLLGDNIYNSGVRSADDDQFRTKFEEPYAMLSFPFYVVLGNHDYGAEGAGSEFGKGAYQVEYTRRSTKWRMPAAHYHFVDKHVAFFALDTNLQMWGLAEQQKKDVRGWLAASTATWKIAFGHHPYLSNGRHGNAGSYDNVPFIPIANGQGVKEFMEQVICGQVDLYLSGHDHSRQWLVPTCRGTELVVSGAGASTTDLPGRNASRFQASTLGFLYVRIQGRTLTAEFLDAAGTVEFTRQLTK